jgi:hypothetical protein
MSDYTDSYKMRYQTISLNQQIEVAMVHAANDIENEDASTPDHANRLAWAQYAVPNSSVSYYPFSWPVCQNQTILTAFQADPTGATIQDGDIQFIVNGLVPQVVANFVANPPPGVTIPS